MKPGRRGASPGLHSFFAPEGFAAPAPDLDAFEERAAIIEHDGGLSRPEAERLAARDQGFASAAAFRAALMRRP
jgi:hypothetical protein